ncbi:MAG: DUF5677 domain-containing protein [Bacteroidia bacterium]
MYQDAELDYIITKVVDIGNRLAITPILEHKPNIKYAEGFAQKIILHCLTVRALSNGFQYSDGKITSPPQIDFPSIYVLARAALETYLAFNYVFISPKNEDEYSFRFLCWDLAGYLERENFTAKQIEHIKIQEDEKVAIEYLKKEIEKHPYLLGKSNKIKSSAIDGQWRLRNSWTDLAVDAGFKETFFNQQYKFLCAYAHSSRLSIIQIQQTKNIDTQTKVIQATMSLIKIVLAKYIYDYVHLMPALKQSVDFNSAEHVRLLIWKNVGDKMTGNPDEDANNVA